MQRTALTLVLALLSLTTFPATAAPASPTVEGLPPGVTLLAHSDVEGDADGWTRATHSTGDSAQPDPSAARFGSSGFRLVAAPDGAIAPQTTFAYPAAVPDARHWAFVRVPDAPAGGGMEILRLLDAEGDVAFALRVTETLELLVLDAGAWAPVGAVFVAGAWTKVEATEQGSTVHLLLDGLVAGTFTRSGAGPVQAVGFAADAAADGELHVDDVAVTDGDAISRKLVDESFDYVAYRWSAEGDGLFEAARDPFKGSHALHLDGARAIRGVDPVARDFWLALNVLAPGDEPCAPAGPLVQLADATGGSVLTVACEGRELRVEGAGAPLRVPASLGATSYTRIVVTVEAGVAAVRVHDAPVGAVPLASAHPVEEVRLGGAGGDLWIDDVRLYRGRLLAADGLDAGVGAAWRTPALPSVSAEETTEAFTGERALRVASLGAPGVTGVATRAVELGTRTHVEARVYVPPPDEATYDLFHVLALADAEDRPVASVALVTQPHLSYRELHHAVRILVNDRYISVGDLLPGWNQIAFDVEPGRYAAIRVNDGLMWHSMEPLQGLERVDRILVGDTMSGATDALPTRGVYGVTPATGRGMVIVDDVLVHTRNAFPVVTITAPEQDVDAQVGSSLIFVGTVTDPDFGDSPHKLDVRLWDYERNVPTVIPLMNGPWWTFTWDTTGESAGEYRVTSRAWQDGSYAYDARMVNLHA